MQYLGNQTKTLWDFNGLDELRTVQGKRGWGRDWTRDMFWPLCFYSLFLFLFFFII